MEDDIVEDLIAYNYARTGRISSTPCAPIDERSEYGCEYSDCDDDCDCDCGNNDSASSGGYTPRSGSGGGCFIATAAYGSPLEANVMILREFRDMTLENSTFGRWLIRMYYRFSPPVADMIATREYARRMVRLALRPLIVIAGRINKSAQDSQ